MSKNPIPVITTPAIEISNPYVIQSGFEYINDDSGPTIELP